MNVIMLLNNGFRPGLRVYKEAKYIVNKGIDIEIVCLDRKNELKNKPDEIYRGIRVKRFYSRTEKITRLIEKYYIINKLKYIIYFVWLIKFIKQVKKYLKNKEYEILHCHDLEMAFCGVLFFKNKKIVFDMHEYYSSRKSKFQNFFINKIVKFIQKRATWIIHVNDFQIKDIKEKDKLVYIPNFPEKDKFKNLRHIKSDKIRISYTGYVRQYELLLNLMKAVNELNKVQVFINGEGDSYEALKKESQKLKNTVLTGKYNHDDISKFYENSDLVYCVYNSENKNHATAIPTKFYEALVSEVPLIVAKGTEMARFVQKYDIGFIVDGKDYEDIQRVIKKIVDKPNLLQEKIKNIKKISNKYEWEDVSRNLNKIYC